MVALLVQLEKAAEEWDEDLTKELVKLELDSKTQAAAAPPPAPSMESSHINVRLANVRREGDDDLPVMPAVVKLERRSAGEGRGQGMFATEALKEGENAVRVRPAISVIFDAHCQNVCGYCFAPTGNEVKL